MCDAHEDVTHVQAVCNDFFSGRGPKRRCIEEARLAFVIRSQTAVSTITMAATDHYLGPTADTEDPAQLLEVI